MKPLLANWKVMVEFGEEGARRWLRPRRDEREVVIKERRESERRNKTIAPGVNLDPGRGVRIGSCVGLWSRGEWWKEGSWMG